MLNNRLSRHAVPSLHVSLRVTDAIRKVIDGERPLEALSRGHHTGKWEIVLLVNRHGVWSVEPRFVQVDQLSSVH